VLGGTVDATCKAVEGVENSVRNGGTADAAKELATNQQATVERLADDQGSAAEAKVGETGSSAGTLRSNVVAAEGSIEAGSVNLAEHIDESERGIESLFVPSSTAGPCSIPDSDRPLVQHVRGKACDLLSGLIGIPSDQAAMAAIQFLASLGGFDQAVIGAVSLIEDGADLFVESELGSVDTLLGATLGNTDTAGSGTVTNAARAVRCIRKGDYDGDGQVDQEDCPRPPQ
jgi:hypothetical protein